MGCSQKSSGPLLKKSSFNGPVRQPSRKPYTSWLSKVHDRLPVFGKVEYKSHSVVGYTEMCIEGSKVAAAEFDGIKSHMRRSVELYRQGLTLNRTSGPNTRGKVESAGDLPELLFL